MLVAFDGVAPTNDMQRGDQTPERQSAPLTRDVPRWAQAPEPDWESPAVRLQLQKLREVGREALKQADSRHERKKIEKFYSEKGLRRRIRLLSHPAVIEALEAVWQATDVDRSATISRDEYIVMHRKLVIALNPHMRPLDAFWEAISDWHKDSRGEPALNKERFFWSWFELVDLWCEDARPESYVELISRLIVDITTVDEDGVIRWASDGDVLESYFRRCLRGRAGRD